MAYVVSILVVIALVAFVASKKSHTKSKVDYPLPPKVDHTTKQP